MGTALSAPVVMLAARAWAIVALFRRPDAAAERALGGLGATMVAGYLAERLVRQRLAPSGWDAAETPVVAAGICLAAVMAVTGLCPASTQAEIGCAGPIAQAGRSRQRGPRDWRQKRKAACLSGRSIGGW